MGTKNNAKASRGDVWFVDLSNPPQGHEQAGNRPALVISTDKFNHGPAELVIAIPISKTGKGIPTHVEINPPEGGVTMRCYIKCEALFSISSTTRLIRYMGKVKPATIEKVEENIKILLELF
jgi:mRNA interferase MazF